MIELIVKNIKEYTNLKYFLQSHYSKTFTNKLLHNELVEINNIKANSKQILKNSDKIIIHDELLKSTGSIIHNIIPLDIVYEDEFYLLVNKPSGMLTTPSKLHPTSNLASAVSSYMTQSNFIFRTFNRLDKDTSGLVLIAKDYRTLINTKQIDKVYYALATGTAKEKKFIINKKIETLKENGKNIIKRIVSENGKSAKTEVNVLKQYKDYFLAKILITHGRTHQIRVHLSSINHPLLSDEIYGKGSKLINHTALVCKELKFTHWITGKLMGFEIDFPEDIKKLL